MGSVLFRTIVLGAFVGAQGLCAALSEEQTKDIQGVVKDYLLKNPDVVAQSIMAFQEQQAKARQGKVGMAIVKNKASLEATSFDPVLGNPNGSQVMVAFLDPYCGHCRAFHKVMDEALSKEKDLKIIVKNTPIFGEPSLLAVKALMAANKQGFYAQASVFMDQADPKQTLEDIADGFKDIKGFDMARFKKDMASKELDNAVKGAIALAEKIGVNATPTLIINGRFIEGGMPYDALKELLSAKA